MNFKRLKKLPALFCLCIWSIIVCVMSGGVYGLITHQEHKEKVKENTVQEKTSSQDEPFRGNNIYTYIELLKMPAETVFENIRVMITNKKNNSIFFSMDDYAQVRSDMEAEGYRGKLVFQQAADREDCFVVINELPLEEYLYGVVPSEMPASYPKEALKAQAICARTYAVIQMMNPAYPDYNAHVNDTTSFQVYHNIDEQETTNRAVDETAGQLLFEENGEELAEVYYYSTSCGQTCEASTNVEFKEYITKTYSSDVEADESWYRWTCEVKNIDEKNMLTRMQARYKSSPGKMLTMTGRDSFESLPIHELGTIKELFISKRGDGGVGEELIITTKKNTYKVVGEYNIRYVLNDPTVVVKKQDGSETTMATLLPSAFIYLEAVKSGDGVAGYEIIGGGYGHGVGMSQNGAKGMANIGYSAEEILTYFFPGSQILENF